MSEGKSNNTTLMIVAAVGAVFAIIMLVVFIIVGMSGSSGPNPNGDTADQYIDVTPNSPIEPILKQFARFTDTDAYLAQNSAEMDRAITSLQELDKKVWPDAASGFEGYDANRRKEIHDIIVTMLEKLNSVKTLVASGDKTKAANTLKDLDELFNKLAAYQTSDPVGYANGAIPLNLLTQIKAADGCARANDDCYLVPSAAAAWKKMHAAAKEDGIVLTIGSAYRTRERQAQLSAKNSNTKIVAKAGSSWHGQGRALDIYYKGNAINTSRRPSSVVAYNWLKNNAARFGWTPYTAEDWHWEYLQGKSRGGGNSAKPWGTF